jgi:DNA ligase-1
MGSRSLQDQSVLYQNLFNQIYKEILDSMNHYDIKNFIIDGEITCFDHKKKTFINFQELRKKINAFDENTNHLQYFYIAFDLLYFNDKNIHLLDIEKRKEILRKSFQSKFKNVLVEKGKVLDLRMLDNSKEEIIDYFNFSKKLNCEGIIGKEISMNSQYNFGKRKWLKLKELDYTMSDTLDLVPIAGYQGKGNSKNLITSFLVASYDPLTKSFHAVSKVGTGFNIQDLIEFKERSNKNLLDEMPDNYFVPKFERPSHFFKAFEVWEIGFDSFSESMNYSIGKEIILKNKGLSLRFPRFIKLRNDKIVSRASTNDFIIELYNIFNSIDD